MGDVIKKGVKGLTSKIIGGESGQDLPGKYNAQDVGKTAQGFMNGVLGETAGEKSAKDVMGRMQEGLGGYTDEQSRAMFQKEADMVRQQQALGSQQARKQAQVGGLGGGFAAKMQERLGQQAGAQQASLGRDLSLQNIDEQQRRLQNLGQYSGQVGGMESARRGQAFQAAGQQAGEDRSEYDSKMARYKLDPKTQSAGIFGAMAERALPGMGKELYKGVRYG